MNEWNIQSRGHACQSCNKAFTGGETYHTILFDEKKDFVARAFPAELRGKCEPVLRSEHEKGGGENVRDERRGCQDGHPERGKKLKKLKFTLAKHLLMEKMTLIPKMIITLRLLSTSARKTFKTRKIREKMNF